MNRTRNKKCSWKNSVGNASRSGNELYIEKNGMFVPVQLFHYNSIQHTIELFLRRPQFVHQLTNKRKGYSGFYSDIQDAHAYKTTFKMKPSDPLPYTEESSYNILISLFINWFQLYSNNSQDLDGIYASVQNLYPSKRHLPHNTLTLGIMNGPHEISYLHINHYLNLIVKELQVLQRGVVMKNCFGENVVVKVAVNHFQADLPAIRKMLGFISHNADVGCSNCSNPFPKVTVIRHGNEQAWNDYSITDTTKWTPCTLVKHKEAALLYLNQDNISARDKIKKKYGVLHSAFLKLDYFNPITDGGIDIMHLLLNGITKRIVHNIWFGIASTVDDDHIPLLGNAELCQMEGLYGRLILPLGYENNLKRKICTGTGFSNLKSAEWLAFLMISPLVLLKIITGNHYKNFLILVKISRLVCSTCITDSNIELVRNLCFRFVDNFKAVYRDPRYMSINLHMLLYLSDQNLKSFGSGPASWCFVYESRNKAFKAINTNGKINLETSLLKRHLIDAHLEDCMNTLPLDMILNTADISGVDVLSKIQKRDNENALKMDDRLKEEYLLSMERFDFQRFLDKRLAFEAHGFEHLPPSAVKSLKFKKECSLSSADFSLLLGYYTTEYQNFSYTLATGSDLDAQDLLNDRCLRTKNKVLKFLNLSLFHSKYKSCESNMKGHRGSHIFAFSKSKRCLAPAQIL